MVNEPLAHQVMDAEEITRLLGMIAAFDGRTSGASEVLAWQEIAARGRWTYDEARAAVLKHFEEDHEKWLMPGRVNKIIRETRQDSFMRQPVATAYGDVVAEETIRQRLMALFRGEKSRSKARSKERRRLVLAHEDLRKALCAPLIGYSRPENWNGWIPPESDSSGARNDSSRRAALVALVAEAERRAQAAEPPATTGEGEPPVVEPPDPKESDEVYERALAKARSEGSAERRRDRLGRS
jgi:hypothetical protein